MNKKCKNAVSILFSFFIGLLIVGSYSPAVKAQDADNGVVSEIQERGTLRLGTSADFPPFEFHAEVDGERVITGVDIMFAQDIADELGVELEIHDMSFDSLIPALETNSIDVIISGLTPTPEREESMLFSDIYFTEEQNLVVQSEDVDEYSTEESLEGATLGVQSGSIQEGLVADMEGVESMVLTNISDLMIALESGRVDGVVLSRAPAALRVAQSDSLETFPIDSLNEEVHGVAVGMNHGGEDLKAVIDGVIADLNANNQFEEYLNTSVDLFVESGTDSSEEDSQGFFAFITEYADYFWEGTKITLLISVASVGVGLILGIILALMRISNSKILSGLAAAYVEFIRGTPLMIQVMIIFFGATAILPLSALASGIIAVSLNSGAYICEIIRSGLSSVDKGQAEAARSLGMSKKTTLQHIVFPQALKTIWPSLGSEFITIIKETSIVSVIGVAELTFQSRTVRSISFQGILPLFVTMLVYFIITFTLTKLLNYMENRMAHD